MVEKFIKFIEKSPIRNTLLEIVEDIYKDNLNNYQITPIQWNKWLYRIRKWTIRIIFRRTDNGNRIIDIKIDEMYIKEFIKNRDNRA